MTASVLTRSELEALSNPDRSCRHAASDLERIVTLQRSAEAGIGSVFDESLRLKQALDDFEARTAKHASWEALAVLVHAEYRLWTLNAATPLRHNPFLSHWIEAIQRLDGHDRPCSRESHGDITAEGVFATRVALMKLLLQDPGTSGIDLDSTTPRELFTVSAAEHSSAPFDMAPFVRMLEEEGIYEASPEPEPTPTTQPSSAPEPASQRTDFQHWKTTIPHRLATAPGPAIQELTRLPIELPSLDFLTTLLTERTLATHAIDPAPVITSYIQHALRRVEQMGFPPESGAGAGAGDGGVDYGREAQSRAVRLLLLFIKNLMRKGLVGIEVLYFEIQEICVRYVWIREVREFRGWVEEGGEN